MMLRWIVTGAVLMTAVPAAAESWYLVNVTGGAPERRANLIAAEVLDGVDSIKLVRSALLYEKPDAKGVAQVVTTNAIDCESRTVKVVNLELRDQNGVSLGSQDVNGAAQPIQPSTPRDLQRIAACENRFDPGLLAMGDRNLSAIARDFMGD